MDDYENPRVRRLRSAAFRHNLKAPDVTTAILRMTRREIARLKFAVEAEGKDFLRALVAKTMGVDFDAVTQAQIDEAQATLDRYKLVKELEAISEHIPQKRGVAEFLRDALLEESGQKVGPNAESERDSAHGKSHR